MSRARFEETNAFNRIWMEFIKRIYMHVGWIFAFQFWFICSVINELKKCPAAQFATSEASYIVAFVTFWCLPLWVSTVACLQKANTPSIKFSIAWEEAISTFLFMVIFVPSLSNSYKQEESAAYKINLLLCI